MDEENTFDSDEEICLNCCYHDSDETGEPFTCYCEESDCFEYATRADESCAHFVRWL